MVPLPTEFQSWLPRTESRLARLGYPFVELIAFYDIDAFGCREVYPIGGGHILACGQLIGSADANDRPAIIAPRHW